MVPLVSVFAVFVPRIDAPARLEAGHDSTRSSVPVASPSFSLPRLVHSACVEMAQESCSSLPAYLQSGRTLQRDHFGRVRWPLGLDGAWMPTQEPRPYHYRPP